MPQTLPADDHVASILGLANQAPVFAHEQPYAHAGIPTGFLSSGGSVQSLVQATDGSLYMAYIDDMGKPGVIHQTSNGWEPVTFAALGAASTINMASGADGTPYMLLMKNTSPGNWAADVFMQQGSNWVQLGESHVGVAGPGSTRLVVGDSGMAYLTYLDTTAYQLNVTAFSSGTWSSPVPSTIAGFSNSSDASVGDDGGLYMSFRDGTQGNKATVMRFDGADWSIVGTPGFSDVVPYVLAMTTGNDRVYAAYGDDNSGGVRVMQFDGLSWSTLPTLPGVLSATAVPYELSVGDDGALYLIAKQGRYWSGFHVLRYADDTWTVLTAETVNVSGTPSVVVGENGNVYAAYYDYDLNTAVVQALEPSAQASARTTGVAVDLGVTDADGDHLAYSIAGGRDSALFEATGGGIRFIEQPTEAGTYVVRVTVADGSHQVTRLVSVTVTVPVNISPVLDSSASPAMSGADAGVLPVGTVGTKVADLLNGSVSDADGDAVGMAITGINGGKLYYSEDGGTSWRKVTGTVSVEHALALKADARIYFEATGLTPVRIDEALTFRAWDGTDSAAGPWLDLSGVAKVLDSTTSAGAIDVVGFKGLVYEASSAGLYLHDPADLTTPAVLLDVNMDALRGVAAGSNFVAAIGFKQFNGTDYAKLSVLINDVPYTVDSGMIGANPVSIAAHGDTILVGSEGQGLLAIRMSAQNEAVLEGIFGQGTPLALALDDTRFVFGDASSTLTLIDRATESVTSLDLGGLFVDLTGIDVRDLALRGDYLFVAARNGGLLIADLSDMSSPQWVAQVALSGSSERVVVIDDRAFVITNSVVQVIDLTDIAHPQLGNAIDIPYGAAIAQVGKQLVIATDDRITLASTGALPNSVSADTDTVAIDFLDITAPVMTLPSGVDAHLRGADLTITSNESGTVFLVKAGAHVGTPTASELTALVTAEKAVAMTVTNGKAIFHTDALLGSYLAYAVDAAGNVSTNASNSVLIRTVPALTISSDPIAFTEGDAPVAVSPQLVLSDDDAAASGLLLAYVRLVADSPILIGGSPIGSVSASESLVLVANPATMGSLTGVYSADEGVLTITGTGTLAQWQAALRAVKYSNTSKTPLAGREVEITVLDTDEESFAQKTVVVEITAVDNPPVITGVPQAAQVVTVGSAAELAPITVSDPDSTTLTVTLTPSSGKLYGVGVDLDGIATYTGTVQQINTYLSYAKFGLLTAGTGSIEISVSDGIDATPTVITYYFTSATVTPPVTPTTPTTPTTPVDGVPVEVSTGSDGQQQIKIPVVTNDRNEDSSTANSKLADITLVKTASGTPVLNLGVPVGSGLTANGPATPVSGSMAQTVLDSRITDVSGAAGQKTAAQNFVSSLEPGAQVVVQTLTVTAQAANGGPLVISANNLQDGHKTALIIDTRALPAGTLIDLENVDFAIIVGDARVTGGAGANIAYGDDNNQFIVLGEGDDILHGLGGNDTVGSLRGNDQTFGDDGDDVVYGGTGDDILHGGAGNDRMNGGFGFDTGVQSGVLADYAVTVEGHEVVLTNKTSGEVDRFLDVEHITFDSGTSIVVAHEASDVASLTTRFADAQLIELNANRAVAGTPADDEVTPELGIALNIDLGDGIDIVRLAGGRTDVHIDVEADQRVELTRLEDGAMLAFNNVELLAFANGNVTVLAHNHNEAVVGRAYELLLGRNVDTGGYKFWIEGMDKGVSLNATLTAMMQSPEFTGASLSNSAFLDLLYTTGFDRTADAGGKAFWLSALDSGVSRAQVLEGFAASGEAVAVIGSTIDVTVVS